MFIPILFRICFKFPKHGIQDQDVCPLSCSMLNLSLPVLYLISSIFIYILHLRHASLLAIFQMWQTISSPCKCGSSCLQRPRPNRSESFFKTYVKHPSLTLSCMRQFFSVLPLSLGLLEQSSDCDVNIYFLFFKISYFFICYSLIYKLKVQDCILFF